MSPCKVVYGIFTFKLVSVFFFTIVFPDFKDWCKYYKEYELKVNRKADNWLNNVILKVFFFFK